MVMHIATRRVLLNSTAVRALSGAGEMLRGETQGLSLSFTDTHFLNSTSHYGSARVKDTGTPANNYNSHPFGLLTYSSPSLKLCRGPDGNLRYGAHNLILQSENLQSASWTKFRATAPAPSSFRETTDTNSHILRQTFSSFRDGGFAGQFEIKGVGRSRFQLRIETGSAFGDRADAYVDLSNVGVDNLANFGTYSGFSVTVSEASDGYYLVTFSGNTGTKGGDGSIHFNITAVESGTTVSYAGDVSKGFDVRKLHLRRTPSDDTYLKTTNAAVYELPYEWDENGDLLGIRVEEQRTNLFLNNRAPVTQDITVTAQDYTLSFYGTGSITLSGAHSDTLNGTGEDDRVTLTFTPSVGTLTCTVDGDIDFVQLEAGSSATSPIETAGSTVTRAADNISLATSRFPLNGAQGALYGVVRLGSGGSGIALLSDGTSNNQISVNANPGNGYTGAFVRHSGSVQVDLFKAATSTANSEHRQGFAWQENDFAYYTNGVQGGTSNKGTIPALTTLRLGFDRTDTYRNGHLKSLVYLPRRMTNTELQEISS